VELSAELEAVLREMSECATVEVRENGGRIAALNRLSWEVRGRGEKPLLHLWSGECNLTRRVLAITDHSEQRLALAVERFGKPRPDRLEFVRVEFERPLRQASRDEYCRRFGRVLAEQFPDETIESLTVSADLEHSLSGSYARGVMRRGSNRWAVLGIPEDQLPEQAESSLTFGILWLERLRNTTRGESIGGLRIVMPEGRCAAVCHRADALNASSRIEIYEWNCGSETVRRIEKDTGANLDSRIVVHRETQLLCDRAHDAVEPILRLDPRAIAQHALVESREVWLRFRGIPFACWKDGRIHFGGGKRRQELTSKTQPQLQSLVRELATHRQPLATDSRHPLYRAQSERWLESMVREDVTRIDAVLDPRFAYSQVFASAGSTHGILDLLCVTRNGRLAILELKASEHIHLPLQAADYWLRVRRHLELGDWTRLGYFPGVELQSRPPLVYLMAPLLRFHPTTDLLLRYLRPDMEVIRIGIAENWRRGIQVMKRQ
jgi:hypothetical protein